MTISATPPGLSGVAVPAVLFIFGGGEDHQIRHPAWAARASAQYLQHGCTTFCVTSHATMVVNVILKVQAASMTVLLAICLLDLAEKRSSPETTDYG